MRIAFFLTSFRIGGIENVFIDLANYFVVNNEITLIVCKDEGLFKDRINPNINIYNLGNIKLRNSYFPLIKAINKIRPDIVLTGSDVPNIILSAAKCFICKNTKIVLSQHNYLNNESSIIINKKITQEIYHYFYKKADLVIGVSEGIVNFLQNDINITKVKKIYNPINVENIKKRSEKFIDNLPDDYIFFAGRLSVVKNIPLLLRAFANVVNKYPKLQLLIAGEGAEKDNLVKLIKELSIERNCKFVGVVDTCPYIVHSKALMLVSFSEAFPVSLLESFSLNVPIIVTPTKGALEIISDNNYPYIMKSFDNANELSKMVCDILGSEEKYDFSLKIENY